MKIQALDLKKQIAPIRGEIDAAIKEAIDNTSFILGEGVRRFEGEASKYCGAKYAIGVSNGSDAISLALLAAGICPGDGVICPSFTYYATAGAVAAVGARPVFADIDGDTYNISLESLERVLSGAKKMKIKAVIPVHLYGQCADMQGISKIAAKFKLKVIEDAAQAFGAEFKGRKAGTIGDFGAVSFYPGKNLGAFGDAGMVLTSDKKAAGKLDILRNQGNRDRYHHILLGRNNRLDTIQAVVLGVKLKHLDEWNRKRQQAARYYDENLIGSGVKTPFVPRYTTHIYHQYSLRGPYSNERVVEYLQAKGIDSRIFYPVPLHLQKCFAYLGYKRGDFPVAEEVSKKVFTLPVYPEISRQEQDYVIQAVKDICNKDICNG